MVQTRSTANHKEIPEAEQDDDRGMKVSREEEQVMIEEAIRNVAAKREIIENMERLGEENAKIQRRMKSIQDYRNTWIEEKVKETGGDKDLEAESIAGGKGEVESQREEGRKNGSML
ncbi:hypothetical protein RIF29_25038 [Crotalaria pallida]|uniref:Uncharacterized protein n=1 Tax=Crotalaria pallida TaxID=3830 RepID=A0AAN9ELL0_CROPI